MMNVTDKLCKTMLRRALQCCRTHNSRKNIHITSLARNASAYEGPGKTTVTFLNKESGPRIMVSQCDEIGFTLHNGLKIIGPTVLFPRQALCWNIASGKYVNDAALSLFAILEPKPDLLVIGLDEYDFSLFRSIKELTRKLNISVEILPVFKACTVFNFVNAEGRYVIAALIPQKRFNQFPKIETTKEEKNSVRT